MKLERKIDFYPAHDKRNDNPEKDYGIGSCRIMFAVVGEKGAISIVVSTNWFLPSTIKEYKEEGIYVKRLNGTKDKTKTKFDLVKTTEPVNCWSWDIHSKKPLYKGDKPLKDCKYIGKCYCDGSSLKGEKYLQILLEKGSDDLFKKLEEDYKIHFGDKK